MIQPATERRIINLGKMYGSLEYGTEAISVLEIGRQEKKNLAAFLQANTKAMDLGFMALIAYSVLFGVLLQDTRVSGELAWQSNKLLLLGEKKIPVPITLKGSCSVHGAIKTAPRRKFWVFWQSKGEIQSVGLKKCKSLAIRTSINTLSNLRTCMCQYTEPLGVALTWYWQTCICHAASISVCEWSWMGT